MIRFKGVAKLGCHDTENAGLHDLKRRAQITHRWSVWFCTKVESTCLNLSALFEIGRQFGKIVIRDGILSWAAHAAHKTFWHLESTQGDVLGADVLIPSDQLALIGVAVWLFEFSRVHGGIHPFFVVGVGRRRFFATTDFLLGLRFLVLHPLINLLAAHQTQSRGTDAVIRIDHRLGGLGITRQVDEFLVVGSIDFVSGHMHDSSSAFLEAIGSGDSAGLHSTRAV